MIRLEGVSAIRGGQRVLSDLSCDFALGETTAIIGRSGSGKSTLLRLVNRLLDTSEGRVVYAERDVREWDDLELKKSIGFVPQSLGLFPHWTVQRHIARFCTHPYDAAALAASVGLKPDLLARYPSELSGGERQRVALARALAGDPPVILMDEPFSALDPLLRAEMQDLVLGLQKTILFVTHDLREALRLGQKLLFLRTGKLVFDGAPAAFADCADEEAQAYWRTLAR